MPSGRNLIHWLLATCFGVFSEIKTSTFIAIAVCESICYRIVTATPGVFYIALANVWRNRQFPRRNVALPESGGGSELQSGIHTPLHSHLPPCRQSDSPGSPPLHLKQSSSVSQTYKSTLFLVHALALSAPLSAKARSFKSPTSSEQAKIKHRLRELNRIQPCLALMFTSSQAPFFPKFRLPHTHYIGPVKLGAKNFKHHNQ